MSGFDYVSGESPRDTHAFSLHVWVLSGLVFQQRAIFLSMQVVLQLLIISRDSQQPLALVEIPTALQVVSPAAWISRCHVCLYP